MPERRKSISIGILAGSALILVTSIIISIAMLAVDLPDIMLSFLSILILSVSCYFAGYISTQLYRKNGLLQGMICGLIIFLAMLLLSILSNGFSFTVMLCVKAIGCTLFGIIGGISGVNTKKTNKP